MCLLELLQHGVETTVLRLPRSECQIGVANRGKSSLLTPIETINPSSSDQIFQQCPPSLD